MGIKFWIYFIVSACAIFTSDTLADGSGFDQYLSVSDKEFVTAVRHAVKVNDVQWISEHCSYPLPVHLTQKNLSLASKEDFVDRSKLIFTKEFKQAVVDTQVENSIKTGHKIVVGQGAIWIETVLIGRDSPIKGRVGHFISAINIP